MQRIKELDGLRAIAILLVLGAHYWGFATLLHGLPEFGWIGVDIFFVLSGYLITTILLRLRDQPQPYKTFYSRRAIRIFPPYLAATLCAILLGLASRRFFVVSPGFLVSQIFFLQAFHVEYAVFFRDLILHPRWYIVHPPSLLTYAHHLPLGARGLWLSVAGPSGSYWSLSIEEYFYLFWAPVVLRARRSVIVLVAIGVCLLEISLRWYYPGYLCYFGIFFRFDALLYGALLALALEKWYRPSCVATILRFLAATFSVGVLGTAAVLFAIRPILGYEIRQSPLVEVAGIPSFCVAIAALLGILVVRAGSSWWFARLLRTSFFQFLGTISYTMYLVHILVALVVMMTVNHLLHFALPDLSLSASLISTGLTVLAARLSWHYLEKPLLRWKDRRFPGAKIAEPVLN